MSVICQNVSEKDMLDEYLKVVDAYADLILQNHMVILGISFLFFPDWQLMKIIQTLKY